MSNTKYKRVTEKQSKKYMDKAREWFAGAPNAVMFNDCKLITIRSVAEYEANKDGKTLFQL